MFFLWACPLQHTVWRGRTLRPAWQPLRLLMRVIRPYNVTRQIKRYSNEMYIFTNKIQRVLKSLSSFCFPYLRNGGNLFYD